MTEENEKKREKLYEIVSRYGLESKEALKAMRELEDIIVEEQLKENGK